MLLGVINMLSGKKIGYCLCGSFCTINSALGQIEVLRDMGAEIIPVISESVQTTACRFCTPTGIVDRLRLLCSAPPITEITPSTARLTLSPKASATRAEIATLLHRYLTY